MKNELLALRKRIKSISKLKTNLEDSTQEVITYSQINLKNKIDTFLNWYENQNRQNYYSPIEYSTSDQLKKFIEKMAIWYELKYPDYEINRLIYYGEQDVNEELLQYNPILNQIKQYLSANELHNLLSNITPSNLYDTKSFISSLSETERKYLSRVKYDSLIKLYLDSYNNIFIYLSSKGTIQKIEQFVVTSINGKHLKNSDLIGKNIKDALFFLKDEYQFTDIQLRTITSQIKYYEQKKHFKEELLNCVMYEIIERGGPKIGPRRAFLFAQEFHRNIDVPMMYGVDYSDIHIKELINAYLKSGGNLNLNCYINYGYQKLESEIISTTTIEELLNRCFKTNVDSYTKEEKELQQRLIQILAQQVDSKWMKKEKIKIKK